jgi:hypothetical protein
MAATLTNPQIGMAISGLLTSGTFPVRSASPTHQNTSTPAVGNSAGQVNRLYQAAFTVASSGSPTSIDLTTLVDIDGTTINFVNIYSIEISNDSVTTGENMTLFGGTNGLVATSTLPLYGGVDPGAMLSQVRQCRADRRCHAQDRDDRHRGGHERHRQDHHPRPRLIFPDPSTEKFTWPSISRADSPARPRSTGRKFR